MLCVCVQWTKSGISLLYRKGYSPDDTEMKLRRKPDERIGVVIYHLDHLSSVYRPLAFPTCDVKSVGLVAVGWVGLDLYRSDTHSVPIYSNAVII